MLECVINLSEGRDTALVEVIARNGGRELLDVHADPDHNRSVVTVIGEPATRAIAAAAVLALDLRAHGGAHPRLGVVDVVPFVPLGSSTMADALEARDRFGAWLAAEFGVPCFVYGPERSLPDVRRRAFDDLAPDFGPPAPHKTAGATAVGARAPLVAYNLWLEQPDLALAKQIARELRGPFVRTLGLVVGPHVQVSMNLIEPTVFDPADAFDAVSARAPIARAELVGLVPRAVLDRTPRARWAQLDLSDDRSIEARAAARGVSIE